MRHGYARTAVIISEREREREKGELSSIHRIQYLLISISNRSLYLRAFLAFIMKLPTNEHIPILII